MRLRPASESMLMDTSEATEVKEERQAITAKNFMVMEMMSSNMK